MITAAEATAIVNNISASELYKKTEKEVSASIEAACIDGRDHVEVNVMPIHLALLVKTLKNNGFDVAGAPSKMNSVVKLWIGWPV